MDTVPKAAVETAAMLMEQNAANAEAMRQTIEQARNERLLDIAEQLTEMGRALDDTIVKLVPLHLPVIDVCASGMFRIAEQLKRETQ